MKLTANGSHEITLIPGRDYAIYIAGNFGGGSVALTIGNADLSGVLPVPGYETLGTDTSFILTAPSHRFQISLSGASSPALVADCILCPAGT